MAIKATNWTRHTKTHLTMTQQQRSVQQLETEIKALKLLKHPRIIQLHDVYINNQTLYMVTNYSQGPELFYQLEQHGPFKEEYVRKIIYQLLSALQECHQHHIVHRDISLANIMLESDVIGSNIRLIDFGLCSIDTPHLHKILGTNYYIAPEVIKKDYDQACDIWSTGIVMYCLVTGNPPFNGTNDRAILQSILAAKWDFTHSNWKHFSKPAKSLLGKLLCYDPQKRVTASEALKSKWFKNAPRGKMIPHSIN